MKISKYDLILNRVITEKFGDSSTKQVFEVANFANKKMIKGAISEIFSVDVKGVNIVNVKGKLKRFKGKIGKRASYKKAYVTLSKESKFNF